MLSAVILRNEYVTDYIPVWTFFCIEFPQTLFFEGRGVGRRETRWRFAVALYHGFMEDLVSAVVTEVFLTLSLKRS